MKSLLAPFKNIQLFSLLLGLAFGVFIALVITYSYVLDGHGRMKGYSMNQKYMQETCMKKFGTCGELSAQTDHTAMGKDNPYMMKVVASEEQFLRDMILHHEAAVEMAKQVLTLNPSEKVKELARAIIEAQAQEINNMQSWLIER